jgi:hypothetical protein
MLVMKLLVALAPPLKEGGEGGMGDNKRASRLLSAGMKRVRSAYMMSYVHYIN